MVTYIKRCSFCLKLKDEVKVLIRSEFNKDKCICDECVEKARKELKEGVNHG